MLREDGIECEFSDPDYTVLMPSPRTWERDWQRLAHALGKIPRKAALPDAAIRVPAPEKACSIREAMLSPRETIPAELSEGRVLSDPDAGCPPAVPVVMPGERISAEAVKCFRYYGFDQVTVVRDQ